MKINRTILTLIAAVVAGGIFALPQTAAADSIDGNWCHDDGRRVMIEGSDFISPKGKKMTGNYGRHDFSYVVPPGEAGAGSMVQMTLVDDDTISVVGGASSSPQTWQRCRAPTS